MKKYQRFISELKKKFVLILICVSVTALCYGVLLSHYYRYSRSLSGQTRQDFLYLVESKIFDLKMRMRGPSREPTQVGILAIDEKSLQQFGTYPFSRRFYAQAFHNLKQLGVRWIGFDAVYVEKEPSKLEDLLLGEIINSRGKHDSLISIEVIRDLANQSLADREFKKAILGFQNIVMSYFYLVSRKEAERTLSQVKMSQNLEVVLQSEILGIDLPKGKKITDYVISRGFGVVGNHEQFSDATNSFAFINNQPDDDAINRWVTLVATVDGHLLPSLSLKTVAEYMNREIFVFFDSHGIETLALINRDDESDAIEIPVDSFGQGRVLINHRGPSQSFHHFSVADAYHNSFTPKEKAALKGSVLLLGATATGTNDIRPNPFDSMIDGVENHAAIMDNVIKRDFYKRPSSIYNIERAIILSIGVIFTLILLQTSSIMSGFASILFLIVYFLVDKYIWFENGIWAFTALPVMQIGMMFSSITLVRYVTEEREKRKVKSVFQRYLSPDVIEQVLQDKNHLKLGGQKKELTVLFSDVRGFTTISESLSPEKLSELMNRYFTPMTGIVLKSRGVLDKYIGDAIMAFWGAPLELENSAATACQVAVDMLRALDDLNKALRAEGFPEIDIGIGLNTGFMSVGNMGSHERFAYTVMGDAVNLGSRIEGLTKEYGIKIMITEFTFQKLPKGRFYCRDLDDIRVKGKNEPVKVYHLMRPDFLPDTQELVHFISLFEQGRRAYTSQDWQKAFDAFQDCLQMIPNDKASLLYIERIEQYREQAPGADWDGVYTFHHK